MSTQSLCVIALTVSAQLLAAVSGQIPMTVSTPTTRPRPGPARPPGLVSDPGLWVPAGGSAGSALIVGPSHVVYEVSLSQEVA